MAGGGVGQRSTTSSDFAAGAFPSGIVNFAPGETIKTITVDVAGDTAFEADEGFAAQLWSSTAGVVFDTAPAPATILNDDGSIAAVNPAQTEGDVGSTAFVFAVTLDGASSTSERRGASNGR